MRPYIIKQITLVTYGGRQIPLPVEQCEILRKPLKLVKEKILDAFALMAEPPVKVEVQVRYV